MFGEELCVSSSKYRRLRPSGASLFSGARAPWSHVDDPGCVPRTSRTLGRASIVPHPLLILCFAPRRLHCLGSLESAALQRSTWFVPYRLDVPIFARICDDCRDRHDHVRPRPTTSSKGAPLRAHLVRGARGTSPRMLCSYYFLPMSVYTSDVR